MATCALCGKSFKDRRGLHGHFRFVHEIEYGSGRPAKKTALTEATKEIVERRKRERELYDRICSGEFELIPRSENGQKSKKKEDTADNYIETLELGKELKIKGDKEGDNYVGRIDAFW